MRVYNASTALKALQKARDLDNMAWRQYLSFRTHGAKSNEQRSTTNVDKAAELFLAVEGYLERLA